MYNNEIDRKMIDSLKGIGILAIVLVHYGLSTSSSLLSGIVSQGARGVQLMFIVNAFLIFVSLSKIEWDRQHIISWWKAKFIRLIPLYYFFTILYVLLYGGETSYYLGTLTHITVPDVLANLLFLHGLHPYYINSINLNWFMADLAFFYLIAPVLYRYINSLEKACITFTLSVVTWGCIARVVVNFSPIEIKEIWVDYINIIGFWAELPVILLGIVAYYIYLSIFKNNMIKNKMLVSITGIIFSLFMGYSLIMYKGYFMFVTYVNAAAILLFIFFLAQLLHPWKCFSNIFLATFGKHSYGIYLSHIFIIRLLKRVEIDGTTENIFIRVIGYIIALAVSLVIAILAEKVIDEPIRKYVLKSNRK